MPKGHWIPFTPEEEEKIKNEYLLKPVKTLARELGTTYGRIMRFLKRNNLDYPEELIQKSRMESRFKPGHTPMNKGKKQSEYMTDEAIERTKLTRFKKGNLPHNTRHDGHERISKDGYVEIRVSKGVYKRKHRLIWENANGKIPKGYIVTFKDHNPLNLDIANLQLISMTENMYRNSNQNYPKEIIPSLVLTKQIEHKLNNLNNG